MNGMENVKKKIKSAFAKIALTVLCKFYQQNEKSGWKAINSDDLVINILIRKGINGHGSIPPNGRH